MRPNQGTAEAARRLRGNPNRGLREVTVEPGNYRTKPLDQLLSTSKRCQAQDIAPWMHVRPRGEDWGPLRSPSGGAPAPPT